ncbi:PucR family transcriptional regulator [Streptomyces monticola]|uniref:PucR family transcriptional regulator n=1 Tax=Streptomyces monticola TaxID=2666263 RepID=A0ABW2JH72_9ACTN
MPEPSTAPASASASASLPASASSARPAPPPTPPVALAALLSRADLGLRQVAGPRDEGAVVHWVHTSEMADPYPYLLGGELLLTAGVHFAEAAGADTHLDDYVARIVAAGGAALGFGVAPVHETVPRALIAACDHYGLPLLEVPEPTPFTAVARAVWQLMAEARHAELRRVTEAQQGLAVAAARAEPVSAVLRQLAARLGGFAALLGPDGTPTCSAGAAPGDTVTAALEDLGRVVRAGGQAGQQRSAPAPASATDAVHGTKVAAYALAGGQGLVLALATGERSSGDHTITGTALVLLSLLTAEHQGAATARRSAALVRVLLGAGPREVAGLLGPEPWTVVHARGDGDPGSLGTALGSPLVDQDRDTVRVLLTGHADVDAQPGWTLGVSAPCDTGRLRDADTEAARALGRAEATRAPLVRHGATVPRLAELVAPDEADTHARVLLGPLAGNPALGETLRTWLSLHGSWDRTATALGVHRNTVRQRVARCAALLETDLDDPDVRMELWFALRNR